MICRGRARRFLNHTTITPREKRSPGGDILGAGRDRMGETECSVEGKQATVQLTQAQKDAMMLADYANYSLKGMPW